jgi:hypothetical protein
MERIRWKRLIAAKDSGQVMRLSLQLDAHEIRHAVGAHRPWRATTSEPWLMVPAADFSPPLRFPGTDHRASISEDVIQELATVILIFLDKDNMILESVKRWPSR